MQEEREIEEEEEEEDGPLATRPLCSEAARRTLLLPWPGAWRCRRARPRCSLGTRGAASPLRGEVAPRSSPSAPSGACDRAGRPASTAAPVAAARGNSRCAPHIGQWGQRAARRVLAYALASALTLSRACPPEQVLSPVIRHRRVDRGHARAARGGALLPGQLADQLHPVGGHGVRARAGRGALRVLRWAGPAHPSFPTPLLP